MDSLLGRYYYESPQTDAHGSATLNPVIGSGLYTQNATYTIAADGTAYIGTIAAGAAGQYVDTGDYKCRETFMSFDTSVVPVDATVSSATLTVTANGDNTAQDFTVEVFAYDFGVAVDTTDWQDRSELTAGTLLASYDTSDGWTGSMVFTSESAFLAAIVKGGTTRIVLASDRHRAGTVPTINEWGSFYTTATTLAELEVVW